MKMRLCLCDAHCELIFAVEKDDNYILETRFDDYGYTVNDSFYDNKIPIGMKSFLQ